MPFRERAGDYLLFLGRMAPDKGPAEAIAVARAAGMPLVMAAKCREPAERAYFADHVEPLLGPDVSWKGEVGGALRLELLAGARGLVFPIQWGGARMLMIEAMACGTPVLATPRGAVTRWFSTGSGPAQKGLADTCRLQIAPGD